MHPAPTTALVATLTLLFATRPGLGRADEAGELDLQTSTETPSSGPDLHPSLTVDLPVHAAVTGGLLLANGLSLLLTDRLAAPVCRWCEPSQFERWARNELRWTDTKAAGTLSDILAAALPVGAALTLCFTAREDGAGLREVAEDLLVVTESVSFATLLTMASKFSTGRLRPDTWAGGGDSTADSRMSFWGSHSAFAFSVAAAATQVARMRGRPGWKWLALASFAGASAIGWLRIAADRHWLTDVVVGAGVGTAAGFVVPLLVLHPAGERAAVTLVPAPGGIALLF